jgi:anti-sigma factor RsiW
VSCERFAEQLDDFAEGRLSDVERRAVEQHLHACAECRALLETMRGALQLLGEGDVVASASEAEPGLANDILARTSGPACGSAQALLCDLVDGELAQQETQLVEGHLEHCARCAMLRTTLVWLRAELPQMAALEPRPELLSAILSATTGEREQRDSVVAAVTAAARGIWEHLVARPRLAWEAAYVATVLAVLLFGTPVSPLRGVPSRALAAIQIDPRGAAQSATEHLQRFHGAVGSAGARAWDATGGRIGDGVRGQASAYAAEHPGMPEAWSAIESHTRELRWSLADRNLAGASLVLRALGEDLRLLWRSQQSSGAGTPGAAGPGR